MLASQAFSPFGAALFALGGAFALLIAARRHQFGIDFPGALQSRHVDPTPRIGGLAVYLAAAAAGAFVEDPVAASIMGHLLVAALPALVVGLAEDLTRGVSPSWRLGATLLSGFLVCLLSGHALTRLDIPLVDMALRWAPAAMLVTAIGVCGVSNAINIIDGFHGLASGTAAIALLALAWVAHALGDYSLVNVAVIIACALAGFGLLNFPWGKMFLGDGGAYFAGFALGWVAVLLPARNPSVSPWASLLICAYPVTEVMYSIVRRAMRGRSPMSADSKHLHGLVATKIVQRHLRALGPTLQNATVSVIMWAFALAPMLAAIAFATEPALLMASATLFVAAYHFTYRRLSAR